MTAPIAQRVLLTCAGRRNYLVDYFRDAVGPHGVVLAADADPHAPALAAADRAYVVPGLDTPGAYVSALVALCAAERVALLVPHHDRELGLLSRAVDDFAAVGTRVHVSRPSAVEVCLDKAAAARVLAGAGVDVPRTCVGLAAAERAIADGRLAGPVVVKPRHGSGSQGVMVVDDLGDLPALVRHVARITGTVGDPAAVLVQEHIAGFEYGLDVVNDFDGRYLGTVVRRKLAQRAGETDRAEVVRDAGLEQLGARLAQVLGHVGLLDCDVIVGGGRVVVLDLNPRFGGGYPFSHAAGADVPRLLLDLVAGRPPDPGALTVVPGTVAAKYPALIGIDRARPLG